MIDYGRLDRSIAFYEDKGFSRVEIPWLVTKEISAITKPDDKNEWEVIGKNKVLVASGEQSFLYQYTKGFLPKGKYMGITPCFRDDYFDTTHAKYFIKNELIITDDVSTPALVSLINDCKEFFEKELDDEVKLIKTEDGFDLEYEGIELGSYGIRSCAILDWIYGTALAEPRFGVVKRLAEQRNKDKK
jgi:hypothetical protein